MPINDDRSSEFLGREITVIVERCSPLFSDSGLNLPDGSANFEFKTKANRKPNGFRLGWPLANQ
jgi:hypothetical protein